MDEPLGEAEDALSLPLDETVFLLVDVYGLAHGEGFDMSPDTPEFYRPSADDPVGRIIREKIVPAKAAAKRAGLTGGVRHELPVAGPDRGQRVAEHVDPHLRRRRADGVDPADADPGARADHRARSQASRS